MLYAIIGLLVVILDQAVKYWASGAIPIESTGRAFIPGILSLVNLHNDGAAFGFLAGSNARIPFIIITGVFIVAVILALATKFISGKFARWCLVLVTAGGFSNCIDRVIYGYVQDMFKCELFNFPIFNVADVFISVFAILFVLAVLFERKTVYDDFEDEFYDDEEDDYDEDEEAPRASRRAARAEKRRARREARAAAPEEEDYESEPARRSRRARREEDVEPEPAPVRKSRRQRVEEPDEPEPAPVRKSRKQRMEEEYAQARPAARQEAAPAPARKPAAPVEDPFAEWERANARAAAQANARPVQSSPAPAQSVQRPAAPAKPAAPAQPAQSARPARSAAPAKKPAADEEFSLDDILAEFK